jgi:predicted nucleic acid-binding Zn ribbon protein
VNPSRPTRRQTGAFPRENEPRAAAELAEKVLRHYRVWAEVVADRTVRAWPRAVGERIAAHAIAERLVGSTLYLRVDTSAWMQELTLLKPMLLAELRRELGEPVVEELRFSLR